MQVYANGQKTVLIKSTRLLACVRSSWRGGGEHVNVPCTSSATCCYAAQMSGSAASLYTLLKRPRSACVDTWLEKSVATLEQSMPHGMLSKTSSPTRCVQRSQIFSSYVKCWQWRYVSLHAHLQQKRNPRWSACSEKKERKNLSTCSNEMNPNSTRNTNFAKFSRENLAQFGLQKCLFRYGENTICYKKVVFTSAVPGPLGWMCLIFLQVRQEQTPLRYSKQITIKTRPFTNPSFANQQ